MRMCVTLRHMKQSSTNARMTTKQVARDLDLSVSQVARYAAQLDVEKLPGRTGHYLFTQEDVDRIRELRGEIEAAAS